MRGDPPMAESTLQIQPARGPGRPFEKGQSGNPAGKPPGCRNHASRAAELLLDDDAEALTRKAVALALDGDPTAMRLCFDRIIAPRRARPVHLDLPPIVEAADIANAMGAITRRHYAGRGGRGRDDSRDISSGTRGERLR